MSLHSRWSQNGAGYVNEQAQIKNNVQIIYNTQYTQAVSIGLCADLPSMQPQAIYPSVLECLHAG